MFSFNVNIEKIAVTYERVSTNMQDERGSKEAQRNHNLNFAKVNNFKIIKSFDDTDHGDNPAREGLENLKQYLTLNDSIKYVIVYLGDRFTRDFEHGMLDYFFLKNLGVKLISVKEGEIVIDGTFDSLKSLVQMISYQVDKKKYVDRIKENMYKYAETDRYLGGSIYPWFQLEKGVVNNTKCLRVVKNSETWEFYRKVLLDVIKYRSITKSSNMNNIKKETLAGWLTAPELLGYRTYGKKGKIDKFYKKGRRKDFQKSENPVFPALMTLEEFKQLELIRQTNRSRFKNSTYNYIYTTMSWCTCGKKFAGERTKSKKKYFFYYKCDGCRKRFNVDQIELNISKTILSHPDLKMLNSYDFRVADLFDEIVKLNKEMELKNAAEHKIISLVSGGFTSEDMAKQELSALKKSKDNIKLQIEEKRKLILEEEKKEITEDHIKTLEYLLNNIDNDFADELKEILNLIIKKIVIKDLDNIDIQF